MFAYKANSPNKNIESDAASTFRDADHTAKRTVQWKELAKQVAFNQTTLN